MTRRALLAAHACAAVLGFACGLGLVACSQSRKPVAHAPEPDETVGALRVYYFDGADKETLGEAVRYHVAAWEADHGRPVPPGDLYVWVGEGVDVGLGGGFAGYTRPGRIDAAAGHDLTVWPLYHELTHHSNQLPPHPAEQQRWDAVDARQRELVAALLARRAQS